MIQLPYTASPLPHPVFNVYVCMCVLVSVCVGGGWGRGSVSVCVCMHVYMRAHAFMYVHGYVLYKHVRMCMFSCIHQRQTDRQKELVRLLIAYISHSHSISEYLHKFIIFMKVAMTLKTGQGHQHYT